MAKQIISGNLNSYGDHGQFELDRSVWGFSDYSGLSVRSGEQKTNGLFSCKFSKSNLSNTLIIPCRWAYTLNKKYILKAKVRVPSSNKLGENTAKITMSSSLDNLWFLGTPFDIVEKTVAEATDTWVSIEASVLATSDIFPNAEVSIRLDGVAFNNGNVFIDEFEVFEYIDVEDPPPSCDLSLDSVDIVNDTGGSIGQITVNASGGVGTLEYSKDNGSNWQTSNVFTGLAAGLYFVKVREQGDHECEDSTTALVNAGTVDFDFTANVTHESVAGASDGQISITATGSGTPWTYSINGGSSYQSSNVFNNVAPGSYYVIVKSSTGILVMKQVTVNAGAQQFDKIYFSKNPITMEKTAVSNWQSLVNYRLYNDVRVEDVADSNLYTSKLKVELKPDSTGKALFYLGEAFRDAFAFTPPTLGASDIIRITDRVKRFINYSGQLENTQIIPGVLSPSLPNIAVFGGIDKIHFPEMNFFTDYLPANKKFMTWAPLTKMVDKQQEDFLSYFIYGNTSTLKLRVIAYYDDSTNETSVTKTKAGTQRAQLYQIPAGPSNSGALFINPSKNLIKYTIALLDQSDSLISEVRTYTISTVRHPRTRYFLFLNSLGGYEVLRFTGAAGQRTEFNREVIQKFLSANYQPYDGEFEVNTSIMSERGSYSSGHVSQQWHEYLKDFLLSKRVYDVTTGDRVPVAILSSDHIEEDQVYNRYIRFDARPAYDNTSFTPKAV